MEGDMETNSVDTLNELLRGEISAVETYRQAMEKLANSPLSAELEACRRSHELRVQKLREQVVRLGGRPDDSSGAWGAFAKLVAGGANIFGEKAAIAALEEGEDRGLRLYKGDIGKLDPASRSFVEADMLPEQERTHQSLSTLKHAMH
jgi:hypothetical protein